MKRMLMLFLVLAIATPAMAQFGHRVQKVRDGLTTYNLYSSGNITKSGFFGRETLIDNGTGTRMIAAGGGNLFCLKNNGNIWFYRGGMSWTMADNGTGTSEIWVRGGQVWCRKDNGQVWACVDPYNMQWQPRSGSNWVRAANFGKLYGE
jgi:hypothetical protein